MEPRIKPKGLKTNSTEKVACKEKKQAKDAQIKPNDKEWRR